MSGTYFGLLTSRLYQIKFNVVQLRFCLCPQPAKGGQALNSSPQEKDKRS